MVAHQGQVLCICVVAVMVVVVKGDVRELDDGKWDSYTIGLKLMARCRETRLWIGVRE